MLYKDWAGAWEERAALNLHYFPVKQNSRRKHYGCTLFLSAPYLGGGNKTCVRYLINTGHGASSSVSLRDSELVGQVELFLVCEQLGNPQLLGIAWVYQSLHNWAHHNFGNKARTESLVRSLLL